MMSKKQKIIEMSENGVSPAEIADRLDTTKSYVYKIRCKNGCTTGAQYDDVNVHPDPQPSETPQETVSDDPGTEGADITTAAETTETHAREPETDTNERDEIVLADGGAKEYECGGCGETVEYLDKNCSECGEKLVWSKIDD